jgi:sulfur carrier protein
MKTTINGASHEVAEGQTLLSLVLDCGLLPEVVVVEINGEIIRRQEYGSVCLKENDLVEIIRFVGGG